MAESFSLSSKISRVLDWVGFSQDEIRWRIDKYRDVDTLRNICQTIVHRPIAWTTGSRPEGVGMDVLESDIDVMKELPPKKFIYDLADWKDRSEDGIIFVDTSDVHPGYCRLVRMDTDATYPGVRPTGTVISSDVKQQLDFSTHGPAQTLYNCGGRDIDKVKCDAIPWPPCAHEWIDRSRPSDYPTVDFIQRTRTIHVVPTGYKGSSQPHNEFRFSFSRLELELVHMWPNHVTKCYLLLKLMRKTIASNSPQLSETLCSYHLKTVLFWLLEDMGQFVLRDCSLEECFMLSIERLILYVSRGNIPHYIIRTNNLFDLIADTPANHQLVCALRVVMSEGLRFLLRCSLYRGWCVEMNHVSRPDQRSHYTINERVGRHVQFAIALDYGCNTITQHCSTGDVGKRIVDTEVALRKLSAVSSIHSDDICWSVRYISDALRSTLATQILSYLRHNTVCNRQAHILIKISEKMFKDTACNEFGLLKQANFYFHMGKYKKALDILRNVCDLANQRTFKASGPDNRVNLRGSTVEALADMDSAIPFVSTSVVIMLPEIHATTDALKFELFKPDPRVSTVAEDEISFNSRVVIVDPDVFRYYLQYLCYTGTGQHVYAQIAFNSLVFTVQQRDVINKPSALNVLGYCFKERGGFHQAAACFIESTRIQSKCNVAPVHLAILMAEAMK